jgi:hypothetical protein
MPSSIFELQKQNPIPNAHKNLAGIELPAETVIKSVSFWFDHYNTVHPHRALAGVKWTRFLGPWAKLEIGRSV